MPTPDDPRPYKTPPTKTEPGTVRRCEEDREPEAICLMSNCNRRAPAGEAFCSHHRQPKADAILATDGREVVKELVEALEGSLSPHGITDKRLQLAHAKAKDWLAR